MNKEKKEKISGNVFDVRVLRRIFRFVKPYRIYFYGVVLLTIMMAIVAPLRSYLVQHTIDIPIQQNDRVGLYKMLLILLGLTIAGGIFHFAHGYYSGWIAQHVIRDIRLQLYNHLLKFRIQFFDHMPIGRLVTRNVSDIETIAEIFSNGFAEIAGDLLQLFFILVLMFYTDWKLSLVSLSTLPVLVLATYVFKEKLKDAFNEVRIAVANLNTFVQEHIVGMAIVQIFGSEARELQKFKEVNQEHLQANLRTVLYYSVYFPIAEVIAAVGTGLLVWYGAQGVLQGQVTLGTLVAFIMYNSQFFRPIRQIADRFNTLQLGLVSSDRVLKLLDDHAPIQHNGTYKAPVFKGEIAFQNVWFAYQKEEWVLKNISFSVEKGKMLGLVGATGSGKSSIINLITRFYEINRGKILLDGRDIREYDLEWLRTHIGLVLQDVFLFSDTIRQNITLGNLEITDEQIWRAADIIGAGDFIRQLPGQLDYNVQERGATLSVGQRQLISFIRAIVYDPQMIILDEATSSVDSETEQLVQHAIEKLLYGRTSIVIAHRLATIRHADQILVLDKGEIKERGTHDELLARNGYYAQLYHFSKYSHVLP
ncbi:MAG: ABC transporter ATP-binding protein/permease [Cytophagales bacterium]|nr:ABC transporter ATP-binding protein/permease [Cytophagales bacterium]MDW8385148.1 ABC transporter ATP-binding protein [Flammeovirgaceae bacterium]